MGRRTRYGMLVGACVVLAALAVLIAFDATALASYREQAVGSSRILTAGDAGATDEDTTGDKTAEERPVRTTMVPRLVDLLGVDLDTALAMLGRGATLSATTPLPETSAPEASEAVIVLTAEYAPASVAQPTVVLGLDAEGHVVRAGYEASMASLGYGSISFADALLNVGVIEATLAAAGVPTSQAVALPADPMEYSVYGADGRTLATQQLSFEGAEPVADRTIAWTATLTYDYRAANDSGNLADTRRFVSLTLQPA